MRWQELDLLAEIGLTAYDRKALAALMVHGAADAETLCREGDVPSSKIYQAMEKLGQMGLVEIQPTRPRLTEISRQNAEQFAKRTQELRTTLAALPERARGRRTFVDLALGVESHVKRHVMHLATAQRRIWSYLEHGDLAAIEQVAASGFPILRRVARNATERKVDQRVVFGFAHQTAPRLVSFLRRHRVHLEHVTGVRYSGELGHPFHVVDDDVVILCWIIPSFQKGDLLPFWSGTKSWRSDLRMGSRSSGPKPCGTCEKLISIPELRSGRRKLGTERPETPLG